MLDLISRSITALQFMLYRDIMEKHSEWTLYTERGSHEQCVYPTQATSRMEQQL